jgi:hypothetical protein
MHHLLLQLPCILSPLPKLPKTSLPPFPNRYVFFYLFLCHLELMEDNGGDFCRAQALLPYSCTHQQVSATTNNEVLSCRCPNAAPRTSPVN